jgi:hypothetical protein
MRKIWSAANVKVYGGGVAETPNTWNPKRHPMAGSPTCAAKELGSSRVTIEDR